MSNDLTRSAFEKDNVQTVRAIGNSWVVCKSKSHVGRIYYFNTLTGEAAWNLSDAEIEKAKKRTNILQSQSGAILESCPEPKDPPNDYVHVLKTDNSEVSKQATNNQFTKQKFHLSTCLNTHCVNCPVNTANIINTHPAPTAYNPNIWSIPPNHQIVIAPTNQVPTSLNVAYNNLEQHVSVQDTPEDAREYHSFYKNRGNRNNRFGRGIKKYIPRRNNMNVSQRHQDLNWFNKFNSPSTSNDLREKLSAKSQNWKKSYKNDGKIASNANTSTKQKIQIIKPNPEDLHPSDADDNWLKEHAYVEGTQLKLDVRSLKDIVMVDAKMGCWYIVADSKTLLDHFNFINVIVSSDEKCQLMVSDDTMVQLQMISRSDDILLMSRAHLVLRLLSQQFTTGHAVLGKDQTNDSGSNSIIDFTKKLAEQNQNVVLVSNDIVTNEYNYGINVFTIEQMKEIITNTPVVSKLKLQDLQELSRIKIMVPNETSTCFETSKTTENTSVTQEVVHIKERNNVNTRKNTLKHMGVQTENDAEDKQTAFNDTFHSDIAENILSESEQVGNVHNIDSENRDMNNTTKRRGIRLKRNIFQQSAISNESKVGMKQFKWRRRKKVAETSMECKQPTTDVLDGCSDKAKQQPNFSGDLVEENFNSIIDNNKITNRDPCEDSFSETTSVSCYFQRGNSDKIIIEETSTSGIISNTPSFVESESSCSVKQNISSNLNNYTFDQNSNKCVMFEVENSMMEDRLKMRSDEWLSRFVQVMEEILTEVLRLDPPFHHRSLPPPWTLHEATECIKKKFHTDCDITDAASKLTEVLSRNSDSRGIINSPLKPSAFMEMYSYGVYLVDSLQAVITDFEDLQTAVDSLAKLLADIQNPNEYGANNDSFNEEIDDPTPNASICVSDNNTERDSISTSNNKKEDIDQLEKRADNDGQKSTRKYNLRSSQAKSNEKIPQPPTVAFIRNIDVESTFFSSLKLTKNKNNVSLVSPEKRVEEKEKSNCKDTTTNQVTTEPEIIRHFSKNMKFEERLKNKQRIEYLDSLHDKHVDLEEGEYLDTHHSKHLESEERLNSKQIEYFDRYNYTDGDGEHEEGAEVDEGEDEDYYDDDGYDYYHEENDNVSETDIDSENRENCVFDKYKNRDFNLVIGKILNELQQAFKQVHTFCVNICEELNASVSVNPVRKGEIQERAEAAKVLLDNLIKSLNSIIFREDKEFDIETILQEVGVVLDSSQVVQYRKTIAKGKEQAYILLESVNIVLEAVQ